MIVDLLMRIIYLEGVIKHLTDLLINQGEYIQQLLDEKKDEDNPSSDEK